MQKIVFGGNSLGKINGKNIFVPFGIPGEKVEVRITERKNDYDFGEIVNILESSPMRTRPACKYYGICGGCNMMHINQSYQTELRKKMLCEMFSNNGINIFEDEINVISGPDFNYRARFQLNDGGLSEKRKNTVIQIDECLCAEKPVNNYFNSTPKDTRPKGRTHLFGSEKIVSDNGKQCENPIIALPETKETQKNIQSGKSSRKIKQKRNVYFAGTAPSPKNSVTVRLSDKKITFDVRGFFQSNLFVFEKTCELIRELLIPCENVLDMYAGCGSLSVFAKDKAEKVTLVEHNRDALVFAEQNLLGLKHASFGLSGEKWVQNCSESCGYFDAVVIDPPRSGMEKAVRDYLKKSGAKQIISLSCDPATHARDIAEIVKAGYEIESVYLLDFYPNTSHVESLISLKRN